MTETITAYPVSGLNPVALSIVSETPFHKGGAEPKTLLAATLDTPRRQRHVTLVERERASEYREKWQLLRNAGLPVISTLRESSRGTILLTDLRHDGAEVYGKGMWGAIKDGNYPYEKIRNIDEVFLATTSSTNFVRVQHEAERLTTLANTADIQLPWDDPFEIVVHPNGRWELMIIDVLEADFNDNFLNPRVIAKFNQEYVAEFLTQISEINKVLTAARYDTVNGTFTADEQIKQIKTRFFMNRLAE